MQNDRFKYDFINVYTKTGKKYQNKYCDYYIQDNVLTVFRKESFNSYGIDYYKFEEHYPMDVVEKIECIEMRKGCNQ